MTHKSNTLTAQDRKNIVAAYTSKEDRKNQSDLALQYGCSPVTIRRALAEEGLVKLKGYKTESEEAILEFLSSQGLNDITRLRSFVVQARSGHSAP